MMAFYLVYTITFPGQYYINETSQTGQQARDVFMKFMPAGEMLDQIW
jgi:hypothetical protein